MSLPEALERAASALPDDADAIRPANGDPIQLMETLDDAAATRVLGWLLTEEPDSGQELAAAWAEQEGGEAPLQQLSEATLPKAGRKALRRALHRLRSRGVELSESPDREQTVARLPRIEDDIDSAFVSGVDPTGATLVFLVESNESSGARMFELLLSESRGIQEFQLYNASRSAIRKYIKQIREQSRSAVVEADPEQARALVTRVAARHPADRSLPRSFASWRARLAPHGEDARVPGEALPGGLEDSGDAVERAVELVREGVLGPWPAPVAELGEVADRLRDRVEGRIVLSEAGEVERFGAAIEAAAGELFEGDRSIVAADRFKHSAFVLSRLGKEEDARAALAAARAFTDLPADRNRVAHALVEVMLEPALKSLREGGASAGTEEASRIAEP